MTARTAPLILAGLVAGCAVAGAAPHPAPAAGAGYGRAEPEGTGTSFIEEAPRHWLRAAAVTREIATSPSCGELRDVLAGLPLAPASSRAARYNDLLVPLYFSTAAVRERALGC